jgi:hypothetical protein
MHQSAHYFAFSSALLLNNGLRILTYQAVPHPNFSRATSMLDAGASTFAAWTGRDDSSGIAVVAPSLFAQLLGLSKFVVDEVITY